MGRAADNEKLKLKATFCNNIAVSCVVVGFLVPYLRFMEISGDKLRSIIDGNATRADFSAAFAVAVCMVIALFLARSLRRMANHFAGQIQGD